MKTDLAIPETSRAVLDLRNVTKFYGDFKAVDEVSLQIPAGSIYGFLGPNGAGKTTTIRMVLEIIKPTSGTIRVLGQPSALKVRDRIGYLPEEKGLYKKMKVWSIIAYFATLKGLGRSEARRRAFELLEKYGLKDFAEKPTEALSKGMGQKVQILASIAHDPELVILDEPFSGLDPVNQQVMEEIIRDLARRQRTVIFSTHVMQHAERLCERILLIARGRKIFDGTIAEAKRTVPRRVLIETGDDVAPIQNLAEIEFIKPMANGSDDGAVGPSQGRWEIQMRDNADPQAVLQACFARGIRLRSFDQSEPSLHDVFVQLVGPEAREASFR
ncbi:MAG: ATP-binding cassette domain-containing protein [Verrucomicrobia bacterium]|nr:ATP-binding cassette domain-containing protein [Verrucomicrobiota bacterium]